jgi:hypothetical protein
VSELDDVSVRLATIKLQAIEAKVPVAVREMLGDLPVGSRLQFYTQGKGSLGGLTPIEALQGGQVAAVRRAAEGFRCR